MKPNLYTSDNTDDTDTTIPSSDNEVSIEDIAKTEWNIGKDVITEDAEKSVDNKEDIKNENYVKDTNDSKFFDRSKKNSYKSKKH